MLKDVHSFDMVCNLKKESNKHNPYWIYKVNWGAANNSLDYVFKTSCEMAKIGISMDINGDIDSLLANEPCYFDIVHIWVDGFKSFALWVLHPVTHSVVWLANMEMRTENVYDISIFFQLWNEVLADVKGEPGYHFNLTRFMCGSAGANFQGIQCIYRQLAAH